MTAVICGFGRSVLRKLRVLAITPKYGDHASSVYASAVYRNGPAGPVLAAVTSTAENVAATSVQREVQTAPIKLALMFWATYAQAYTTSDILDVAQA